MRATFKLCILCGLFLFSLVALNACGGSSGSSDPPPIDDGLNGGGDVGNGNGDGGGVTTPQADSYNWTGNTRLTTSAANGLLANDPAGSAITAVDDTTTQGTVTVDNTTGAFTYDPPLGVQNVEDTFTYTVAGVTATVTITLNERVWYVDNSDIGTDEGNDQNPFQTLARAQNASDADDTIFVFTGDQTDTGQNTGIILKAGQKLLGGGVGLRVNQTPVVDPRPVEPLISNLGLAGAAGDTPVVMLATGNEVAGLAIHADFNDAVLATGGDNHDIHDNIMTFDAANGREGIRLLNVTGSTLITANTITGSPRDGIKISNIEDQAGNPVVALAPVIGTLRIDRNDIANPAQDGITVELGGTGTAVTLNILTNTITNPGILDLAEGINIQSSGAASVTADISRNTISGSTDEAIDLEAGLNAGATTSSIAAFVANNDLSGSGAVNDFRSIVRTVGDSFCLELINNVNALGNTSFQVDNNAGGTFQLFEDSNDTNAILQGTINPVAQGACGITISGAATFEANCAVCHTGNGLGFGNVGPDLTNATVIEINNQLINNPTMSDVFIINGRLSLTDVELEAIANALAAAP